MFEDSLFASQPAYISPRSRYATAGALVAQAALLSLLVLIPLLHPEMLPGRVPETPLAFTQPTPPPPPRTVTHVSTNTLAATAATPFTAPAPPTIHTVSPGAPELPTDFHGFSSTPAAPTGIFTVMGTSPHVTVAPAPLHAPVHVSSGVSAGLLLTPIRPVYPQIARMMHTEGTVIVEAVISRTGTIESLHVLSGPAMLQTAAIEAIRNARYQPFLLNGEPVAVQTTVTVNFRMAG